MCFLRLLKYAYIDSRNPSNALRNDLLHPNEFIRGNTLRYLCKLKEAEILEPLIPSVRQCLVCLLFKWIIL
jgi:hypothetical protein